MDTIVWRKGALQCHQCQGFPVFPISIVLKNIRGNLDMVNLPDRHLSTSYLALITTSYVLCPPATSFLAVQAALLKYFRMILGFTVTPYDRMTTTRSLATTETRAQAQAPHQAR